MTYQKVVPDNCPKKYMGLADDTCFKCMSNRRNTNTDFGTSCRYDTKANPVMRGSNLYCFECGKLFFKQHGQYHGKFCCKECSDKYHSQTQSWISTRHLLAILEVMKDGKYYTINEIVNAIGLRIETIGIALRGMLYRNFVERVIHYDIFSDDCKNGWGKTYYRLTDEAKQYQQLWENFNKPLTEPTPEKIQEVAEWEQKRIENEKPNHQDKRWDEQIVPQQIIDINKDREEHAQSDIPLPPKIKIISEADIAIDKFLSSKKDAVTIDLQSVKKATQVKSSLRYCLIRRQLKDIKAYQKSNHVILIDITKCNLGLSNLAITIPFTNNELQFMRENYMKMTYRQIASALNKSENAIYKQVNRLGLKKKKNLKYSADDIKFIRENYATMPNLEICKKLGRTMDSVTNNAYQLGLHKSRSKERSK